MRKYVIVRPIDDDDVYILGLFNTKEEAEESLKNRKRKKNLMIKTISEWDYFDAEKWGGVIPLRKLGNE